MPEGRRGDEVGVGEVGAVEEKEEVMRRRVDGVCLFTGSKSGNGEGAPSLSSSLRTFSSPSRRIPSSSPQLPSPRAQMAGARALAVSVSTLASVSLNKARNRKGIGGVIVAVGFCSRGGSGHRSLNIVISMAATDSALTD